MLHFAFVFSFSWLSKHFQVPYFAGKLLKSEPASLPFCLAGLWGGELHVMWAVCWRDNTGSPELLPHVTPPLPLLCWWFLPPLSPSCPPLPHKTPLSFPLAALYHLSTTTLSPLLLPQGLFHPPPHHHASDSSPQTLLCQPSAQVSSLAVIQAASSPDLLLCCLALDTLAAIATTARVVGTPAATWELGGLTLTPGGLDVVCGLPVGQPWIWTYIIQINRFLRRVTNHNTFVFLSVHFPPMLRERHCYVSLVFLITSSKVFIFFLKYFYLRFGYQYY